MDKEKLIVVSFLLCLGIVGLVNNIGKKSKYINYFLIGGGMGTITAYAVLKKKQV